MPIIDTTVQKESQDRYLTYALSVVSGRAIPDVRDGLKPVQRRILYAMFQNLKLVPNHAHRKSAAVVGEVLANYHPHGDVACYEAMVRMAQNFSLRYPLVDGQGNFGSLDGDNAAAYRYTEARLHEFALEVIGEIGEGTVDFRENFDSTTSEPVVFPSRVPHLLINGATGIAVGMATSIPPHNLREVIKGIVELSEDPEITVAKLTASIRGPDFPTGCQILNSKKEIDEIYKTGRGSIRMRGEWKEEALPRGKKAIIITTIPYAVNKSQLVEKIAGLIIERKVPQLSDVRDESTDEIRIVLELSANADPQLAMAYLYKHTTLENIFPVNLTVLVPGKQGGVVPEAVSLKECLQHFLDFRHEVTRKKLEFEKKKLLERIHILEALVKIFDRLDKAIEIVRKSDGRSDAAEKIAKAFTLTEIQSFAIVDMRIYQLSKTNILEVRTELKHKELRVDEINKLLKNPKAITKVVISELESIAERFGDKRRSPIVKDSEEIEFNADAYVVNEDVHAIVTIDGWIKRIRQSNEVEGTRLREGDAILHAHALSTLDTVVFVTTLGMMYALKVVDFPASSGFGDPVQKILKFKDDEHVLESYAANKNIKVNDELVLVSKSGVGFALKLTEIIPAKRTGKRMMKLRDGDSMCAVGKLADEVLFVTSRGYGLVVKKAEIPVRDSPAVGVSLMKIGSDDKVIAVIAKPSNNKVTLLLNSGRDKEIAWKEITSGRRGLKGTKLITQGEVIGVKTTTSIVELVEKVK